MLRRKKEPASEAGGSFEGGIFPVGNLRSGGCQPLDSIFTGAWLLDTGLLMTM